jgi:hypothetical protein
MSRKNTSPVTTWLPFVHCEASGVSADCCFSARVFVFIFRVHTLYCCAPDTPEDQGTCALMVRVPLSAAANPKNRRFHARSIQLLFTYLWLVATHCWLRAWAKQPAMQNCHGPFKLIKCGVTATQSRTMALHQSQPPVHCYTAC